MQKHARCICYVDILRVYTLHKKDLLKYIASILKFYVRLNIY